MIKNIHAAAGSAIDKIVVIPGKDATRIKAVDLANPYHVSEGLYNQTNEYATLSSDLNTFEGCELDRCLLDSTQLFDNDLKYSPDESSFCTEEFETNNKLFNKLHYTLICD
ncbi:hypothetical protein IW01_07965 [Pectobacterium brasiliense]|uniref:hypothetical protein n=1 Tax=Pectobacterium brasiliense TaxID=180957 RepID=UPI0004E7076E|nr:hypothetical protein [Pectobacterium brasiliense]KFF71574.1 hypothetical protein IW01_07965 [Pectobacterium brasiliense]